MDTEVTESESVPTRAQSHDGEWTFHGMQSRAVGWREGMGGVQGRGRQINNDYKEIISSI